MANMGSPASQGPSGPNAAPTAAVRPTTMPVSTMRASVCDTRPGCSTSRPPSWSTAVSVVMGGPPNGRAAMPHRLPSPLRLWRRGAALSRPRSAWRSGVRPLDGDALRVDGDPRLVGDVPLIDDAPQVADGPAGVVAEAIRLEGLRLQTEGAIGVGPRATAPAWRWTRRRGRR